MNPSSYMMDDHRCGAARSDLATKPYSRTSATKPYSRTSPHACALGRTRNYREALHSARVASQLGPALSGHQKPWTPFTAVDVCMSCKHDFTWARYYFGSRLPPLPLLILSPCPSRHPPSRLSHPPRGPPLNPRPPRHAATPQHLEQRRSALPRHAPLSPLRRRVLRELLAARTGDARARHGRPRACLRRVLLRAIGGHEGPARRL